MSPKSHILFGFFFSLFLFYIFPQIGIVGALIIFLSSFLIDVDHYLYYVYKKKNWSLKKAYKWFVESGKKLSKLSKTQRKEFYTGFCFLHGIEILFILFILGKFVSAYFYYVLIGFSFHIFLDLLVQKKLAGRLEKFSIIYDFFRYKRLKFVDELTIFAS